jgi:hypothetical protein
MTATEQTLGSACGIPFTQYVLPNGRKKLIHIVRPPEVVATAQEVAAMGGRFECEILTTGHVSLTCVGEIDGEESDVAIEVVANGPGIPEAVDRLVEKARAALSKTET